MLLSVTFAVVTDPLGTVLLFSRFGSVGEWSVARIIMVYAMAVTSFGLAESFLRGFDYFPGHSIRTGNFDRMLLRPAPLFTQIAASYFHIHRLARPASGICAICWSFYAQGTIITPTVVAVVVCGLAGGFILYSGAFIFTSGVSFFTIKALDWIYLFTNASYQVTRCPVPYMPNALKNVFTFFMPMLLVSYYPASVACGWGEDTWKGWVALPAGILFLFASWLIWQTGLRHYKSTGS
ncbi:MAG: ABC transporter permease [Defluviitaleaceae bacterium]|nr:ABC transporter permease [Defluviitaleaceae bacterium]